MKLAYPAIFHENDGGYSVRIPDLANLVSRGETLAETVISGTNAASKWLLEKMEKGEPIPKESPVKKVKPAAGEFMSVLALDMDTYTEKYGTKAVRKNLTIPAWLNTFAESQGFNYSQMLQDSLMEIYRKEENWIYYEKYRIAQKLAAEIFAAVFLDLTFHNAYIDDSNKPHLYIEKEFHDPRDRGIFENIGRQFVELEFFDFDYYNEPKVTNPYDYDNEIEENGMWDTGLYWAAYIADEYFETPDFMLPLLLENKDVDRSIINKELGFMEEINKIKEILKNHWDSEQYEEESGDDEEGDDEEE
jgi:predicted RNase H-like HicB family nuclease